MINEEPSFIEVGADVSAKFKGAFCEATVKSMKKLVKCKVLLKNGATYIANDDNIDGLLRVNALVKVKHQENNEFVDGTILKLTDNSLYTVVFDDGDEKTLRRTSLCLKGERHFLEHENLDNQPLNNPENFGAPVSRRGDKSRKRTRLSSLNSFDDAEVEEEIGIVTKKKRESSFGKVFCIELGERRKSWFPALCLRRSMAEGMTIEKDQTLVQSFKDGKKVCVNKTDLKEFTKGKEPLLSYMRGDTKIDPILRTAIEKALVFYDHGELPRGWHVDLTDITEFSEEDEEEVSEEETKTSPEEEEFLTKLYALMEEQGTPIAKPPLLGYKKVNLYKLYLLVTKNGGMDEVSNQSKWRSVYIEMGLTNPPTTASYNLRNFYKRYVYPYEELERGGISPSNEQATNPEPEKEAEKDKPKKCESDSENENQTKRLTRMQSKNESDSEVERRETRSRKPLIRSSSVEKPFPRNRPNASSAESSDESTTSSTELEAAALKRDEQDVDSDPAKNSGEELVDIVNSPQSSVLSEKEFSDGKSENEIVMTEDGRYPIGAKILVKYGKGKTHRAYEAKVIDVDSELTSELLYYVHYRGWNHRYDEWIKHDIITGLSPIPSKKKGGNASKGSSASSKYKHDTPPGSHSVHLNPPGSKQRGIHSPASKHPASHSPAPKHVASHPPSPSKHPTSSPLPKQRATSPSSAPVATSSSRQTSRSTQHRRSTPPPLSNQISAPSLPAAVAGTTTVVEKPSKSTTPVHPKPIQSTSKQSSSAPQKAVSTGLKTTHAAATKPSHAQAKSTSAQPKPAQTQSSTSTSSATSSKLSPLPKSSYTVPKSEGPFPEIKAHPIKPRTTRNSMQDVFLITALEESISAKGNTSRRRGSPIYTPDSPSSESAATSLRSRRMRDKPNPIPEEENESDSSSSSAKEDDVEMPEQNRVSPQKKSNRRKRKDRSPFEKADSKDSGEEDESFNEYPTQSWRERNKPSFADKADSKIAKRREKSKNAKQRPAGVKTKLSDETSKDQQLNAEDDDTRPLTDGLVEQKPGSDLEFQQTEKLLGILDNDVVGVRKRRSEQKYQDEAVMKGEESAEEQHGNLVITTEESNSPMADYNEESRIDADMKSSENEDVKLVSSSTTTTDGDNNNRKDECVKSELADAEEIIGMERVVDILQQAAAINAEKERNVALKNQRSNVKSSPVIFATPEKEREKRKKRKERRRRRRATSCTFHDASESENSMQSPIKSNKTRHQSLDREKFDFVSDLGKSWYVLLHPIAANHVQASLF
eukprot:gene20215-22191_t